MSATALQHLSVTAIDQTSPVNTRVTYTAIVINTNGDNDLAPDLEAAAARRLNDPGKLVDAVDVLPELTEH